MHIKSLIASAAMTAALTAGLSAPLSAAEGMFTQDQQAKGLSEYNTHCRTCHAKDGKGALGPALKGDVFTKRFGGQNATDVRTWIYESMPQTAPKSLKDEQLDPLMAYVLSLNGFTPGDKPFTAEAGKSVQIPK